MSNAKKSLHPEGLLCIRVPNDFSAIQLTAQMKLVKQPLSIATPDHICHLSFQSLRQMMGGLGFDTVYVQR